MVTRAIYQQNVSSEPDCDNNIEHRFDFHSEHHRRQDNQGFGRHVQGGMMSDREVILEAMKKAREVSCVQITMGPPLISGFVIRYSGPMVVNSML